MTKKITIGYISPRITYGVHLSYYQGILNGVRECNLNLLSYIGSSTLNYYEYDKYANIIFDFINSNMMDGLICWSSIFYQNNSFLSNIETFIKKNKKMPFVSIGKTNSDLPAVSINNQKSIKLIMQHLIEHHGYKKIAFIKGPDNHNFAQERFDGYLQQLKNYNIDINEKLISKSGEFNCITGINAVNYFLDDLKLKPKTDIEAIVTSSDLISLGVINELQKRKIKVPGEIAVTGLNNREESLETTPQLTTIDFQFTETAKKAVQTLLSKINNKKIDLIEYVEPKLIIRESCGCLNNEILNHNTILHNIDKNKITEENLFNSEDVKIEIAKQIKTIMFNNYTSDISNELIIKLLNGLNNELNTSKDNEFINVINDFFCDISINNIDISTWENLITIIYSIIIPLIKDNIKSLKAQTIFQNARIMFFLKCKQQATIKEHDKLDQLFLLPNISSSIVSTFDIPKLISTIEKELPKIGIKGCYISLYLDSKNPNNKAQLIMAYNEKGHVNIEQENSYFQTDQLLPGKFLNNIERYELLVNPLFFNESHIGLIIFHESNIDINTYFAIRNYISSALKGAILVKNSEDRSKELEQAYTNLKENQKKLLISDKMAYLGRMTAGIAHEMNTPLATARNASKELEMLIDEYKLSIDNPQIVSDDHKEIAKDMQNCLNIVNQSVEKTISFIRSIKAQIYNQSNIKNQKFNATNLINENLLLLEYLFKKSNYSLTVDLDKDIFLTGEPQSLNQILTNLLSNAIDACKNNEKTEISIILKKISEDKINLIVKDNGYGITRENLMKIFDPFFTTKPFGEGTGLGLSIVYDLVNEFNGYIEVKSNPGETIFSIFFLNLNSGVQNGKN